MLCPKCKQGIIMCDTSLTGVIFNRKRIHTYFCPLCDFENSKEIRINENEYQVELLKKKNTHNFKYETKREDIW